MNKLNIILKNTKRSPLLTGFFFVILFSSFLFSSCQYLQEKIIGEDEKPIARAYDAFLYPSDLEGLTLGMTPEDSATVMHASIEKWLQRQLLLKKAKENIPDDDPAILRKVEDYRESLVLYEYEKAIIADRLDTAVSASDIKKYYDQYIDNFPLQESIYFIQYIKLKDAAPDHNVFTKLLFNIRTEEDEKRIEGYCRANVTVYAFANPLWYNTDNLKSMFLLSDDEVQSLRVSKQFKEFKKEEGASLFLRILEIKQQGNTSPIEIVHPNIAKILIEKRKLKLVEDFYKRVYNEGISSKKAELYAE